MQGIELRIKGKVQGVGFRPFVWLLANQYKLNGDVNNDGQGVLVRFVSPPANALEQFLSDLQNKLPPLAQITDITQRAIDWPEATAITGFTIRSNCNNRLYYPRKRKQSNGHANYSRCSDLSTLFS